MYPAIMEWFSKNIKLEEFRDKRVLEVGSLDVNGSVRPLIEALQPSEYIGIDEQPGKLVDLVLPGERIIEHFGLSSFDTVISTETLEHVEDWRIVINNMKLAIKPEGYVYLTVCPPDMGYHPHPRDCWRFNIEHIGLMFRDFQILRLDPSVFLKARKPKNYTPIDLSEINVPPMRKP